jgi:hypothetical protein
MTVEDEYMIKIQVNGFKLQGTILRINRYNF